MNRQQVRYSGAGARGLIRVSTNGTTRGYLRQVAAGRFVGFDDAGAGLAVQPDGTALPWYRDPSTGRPTARARLTEFDSKELATAAVLAAPPNPA